MQPNYQPNKQLNKVILNIAFFLMYWIVLQDFLLPIIYRIIDVRIFVLILFFSKDIVLILLFALSAISLGKIKPFTLMFYGIFIIYLLVYAVIGSVNGASLVDILSSLRGWMLLPMFLAIGFSINFTSPQFKKKLNTFMIFLVVCAVLGIIEFYMDAIVGTKDFWRYTIGLTKYSIDIKFQEGRLLDGLPGSFYGSYGGGFFSQKRLVSVWAHPLTAGYVLLIPVVYYMLIFFRQKRSFSKELIYFIILLYAVFLTYTRAIIIPLALLAMMTIAVLIKNKIFVLIGAIGAAALVIIRFESLFHYVYDGSTMEHIRQFFESLSLTSPLGMGLGTFGINSNIGTESTYVSLYGQLGIIGVILYMGLMIYVFLAILSARRTRVKSVKFYVQFILFCTVIYYFTGLISEQLFAFTSIGLFYFLLGGVLRLSKDVKTLSVYNGGNTNEDTILKSH